MGVSGQRDAMAALYPRGKDTRYPLYRRLGGPQRRSGHRCYRKNPLHLQGIEPRSPGRPVHSHDTTLTELPRLPRSLLTNLFSHMRLYLLNMGADFFKTSGVCVTVLLACNLKGFKKLPTTNSRHQIRKGTHRKELRCVHSPLPHLNSKNLFSQKKTGQVTTHPSLPVSTIRQKHGGGMLMDDYKQQLFYAQSTYRCSLK
jgi:hypothetical protein